EGVVVPAAAVLLRRQRDRASVFPIRFPTRAPPACFRVRPHDTAAPHVRLHSEHVPPPDATDPTLHPGQLRVVVWQVASLPPPRALQFGERPPPLPDRFARRPR